MDFSARCFAEELDFPGSFLFRESRITSSGYVVVVHGGTQQSPLWLDDTTTDLRHLLLRVATRLPLLMLKPRLDLPSLWERRPLLLLRRKAAISWPRARFRLHPALVGECWGGVLCPRGRSAACHVGARASSGSFNSLMVRPWRSPTLRCQGGSWPRAHSTCFSTIVKVPPHHGTVD